MIYAGKLGQFLRCLLPDSSLIRRLKAHLAIARFDHSIKNVFVLPGIVVPLSLAPVVDVKLTLRSIVFGLLAVTLIACSNYVLNEILDAPYDRLHPTKKYRPAAQGLISPAAGYAQWLLMMASGLAVASLISKPFLVTNAALWIMGCAYNIPPVRTKDLPYLDVLSESINNPLRLLLGWYMVTTTLIPPLTLLVAYWMIGAYFMALKRLSEYREIADAGKAAAYRRSFAYYSSQSLLVSIVFYASASMLFFGAFLMRYRVELICSFPFLAVIMAIYFHLAFQHGSAVQNPEKLYRQPVLMTAVAVYAGISLLLLWIDIPFLTTFFTSTLPKH
jgi:decaprenyl-phosphate phosphoribosyltransferase